MKNSSSTSGDNLICLRAYYNSFDANLALTKLHANGIPAELDGNLWTGVLGVAAPGQGIRLMVFQRDAETARSILDADTV